MEIIVYDSFLKSKVRIHVYNHLKCLCICLAVFLPVAFAKTKVLQGTYSTHNIALFLCVE